MYTSNRVQYAEQHALAVVEFQQIHGRLPKQNEYHNGLNIGRFIAAARGYRSRLAVTTLIKHGVDFSVGVRSSVVQRTLTKTINDGFQTTDKGTS